MPVGDLRFYVNETILKTYLLKIAFLNFVISHFVSPHLKLANICDMKTKISSLN